MHLNVYDYTLSPALINLYVAISFIQITETTNEKLISISFTFCSSFFLWSRRGR